MISPSSIAESPEHHSSFCHQASTLDDLHLSDDPKRLLTTPSGVLMYLILSEITGCSSTFVHPDTAVFPSGFRFD